MFLSDTLNIWYSDVEKIDDTTSENTGENC